MGAPFLVPRPRNRIFFISRVDRKKGQKDKKKPKGPKAKSKSFEKK